MGPARRLAAKARSTLAGVGDIAGDAVAGEGEGTGGFGCLGRREIEDGDVGAGFGEGTCGCKTYSTGCSGDDSTLSIEFERVQIASSI